MILTGVTLELVPGHVDAGTVRILQDQRPAHDRPWTQPVHDSGAWRVHWGGRQGVTGFEVDGIQGEEQVRSLINK